MNRIENKIVVYVVEDSQIICDIMSRLVLINDKISVKTFLNGESVIQELNKKIPHIIFLDYYLDSASFLRRIALFSIIYSFFLVFIETVGYHVFNIHNNMNGAYLGLPVCDCIHAPVWMQISYFLYGPVFFVLAYLLGIGNPYKAVKNKQKIYKKAQKDAF